jgi:hypothetical protein
VAGQNRDRRPWEEADACGNDRGWADCAALRIPS